MSNPPAAGPGDLPPGLTTVAFDPILPPLRIPVPASEEDDPSNGRWLLAFKDEDSWRRGWQKCEEKLSEQCEVGARMGCSITAANVSRIPWWKHALVFLRVAKIAKGEREACEEREMMACITSSKETCAKYARDTCEPVFADVRIADPDVSLDPRFSGPPHRKRWTKDVRNRPDASCGERRIPPGSAREEGSISQNDLKKSTNFRGRKLMTEDSIQRPWDGPTWSDRQPDDQSSELPIDGWEGGLINPKLESTSLPSVHHNHRNS